MLTIHRTAIIVMPGQPVLDWLHGADPTSGGLSLEDLRREPTIYLLPESENEEEAREYLECAARFSRRNSTAGNESHRAGRASVIWPLSITGWSGVFTRWWSISPINR